MFDFIKSSNTDDVKAFQWFIESTGPYEGHPLLTVDMLGGLLVRQILRAIMLWYVLGQSIMGEV